MDVGKIAAEVAQAAAAMEDPRDRAAVTAPLRALVARLVGVAEEVDRSGPV